MTQIFDKETGRAIPVTVVQAGPCTITQIKTQATDGYSSIQIGFDEVKEKALNRPELGHLKKSDAPPLRHLQEFRVDSTDEWTLGQEIKPVLCCQPAHPNEPSLGRTLWFLVGLN